MNWIILAEGEGEWVKVLFGVIVVVIWIVAAIASAWNKQMKKSPGQQRSWEDVLRDLSGEPRRDQPQQQPPAPRQPPMRRPAPPPVRRAQGGARASMRRPVVKRGAQKPPPIPRQPPAARKPALAEAPAEPPHAKAEAPDATRPDIAASEISSKPKESQHAPSADAKALHRWMTRDTLRSQFILTEILQPPMALRGERQSSF